MENKHWNNLGEVARNPHLHPLPKNLERWLPKFNLDDGLVVEEHLHNFMLAINLNWLLEENVVCRFFPYTFEVSVGSWYFSLPIGSINNWDAFEEKFLQKYGDDKTSTTLINDLSNLKVSPNEKNKRF